LIPSKAVNKRQEAPLALVPLKSEQKEDPAGKKFERALEENSVKLVLFA